MSELIDRKIISVTSKLEGFEWIGRLTIHKQQEYVWSRHLDGKIFSIYTKGWPDALVATIADFTPPKTLFVSRWDSRKGWVIKHFPVKSVDSDEKD